MTRPISTDTDISIEIDSLKSPQDDQQPAPEPRHTKLVPLQKKSRLALGKRDILLILSSIVLAAIVSAAAEVLILLIHLVTNICFYGRFDIVKREASGNILGAWVILIPVAGGLVVGLLSIAVPGIRGHGIPEAMESILHKESKLSYKIVISKPISSALTIGTGGPFGTEGPIIATGAAIGSIFGQVLPITAKERKMLLCVGASSGMSFIFGTPVSAVLISLELLLNEYRPASLISVAFGSCTAAIIKMCFMGTDTFLSVPPTKLEPKLSGFLCYIFIGAFCGIAAATISKLLFILEDLWTKTKTPTFLTPAIGSVAVGIIGYLVPKTLGVGYSNISDMASASLSATATIILVIAKLSSWIIALSSGTSGGTLAPLLTIGSGIGSAFGMLFHATSLHGIVDPSIAGLVGMSAIFAGSSRAAIMSVILTMEGTGRIEALLPVVSGTFAAVFVSWLMMHYSIMTEKIHRKGHGVSHEYSIDPSQLILVKDAMDTEVIKLRCEQTVASAKIRMESSQQAAFPVLDDHEHVVGLVTMNSLHRASDTKLLHEICKDDVTVAYSKHTLRHALDHMIQHDMDVLPVVAKHRPHQFIGLITMKQILKVQKNKLEEIQRRDRLQINIKMPKPNVMKFINRWRNTQ